MRKLKLLVGVILMVLLCLFPVCACAGQADDILSDQFKEYDFSDADNLYAEYSDQGSFSGIIQDILAGNFNPSSEGFLQNVVNMVVPNLNGYLLNFVLLFGICLLLSAIHKLNVETAAKTSEIVTTVTNAVFTIILFSGFFSVIKNASEAVGGLSKALDTIIPVLTVAMIASGSGSTAAVLNPESAVLSQFINNIITTLVLPAVIILAVFIILDAVFTKDKFGGVIAFGKSLLSWVVGILFTFYASVVSIKGLAAASYDGISLRTMRYAVNNSVPLVGSLIGDGVNLALACCSMLKSAIGIAAFILIVLSVLSPLLSMLVYMLLLKAFGACVSPFAPAQTITLVNSLSELLKLLISAVIGMTVIFLIIIGIAVGTGNQIF